MNIYLIIIGMAVATYIPRLLPAVLINRINLPEPLERILVLIPYAALGALIFPGILNADEQFPLIGIAGGITAVFISYKGLNVIYTVTGSIIVVFLLKLIVNSV